MSPRWMVWKEFNETRDVANRADEDFHSLSR